MNLEQDQEVEEFQVGGMNFAPHIAVTPNKKGGRLILEKGKCFSSGQKQIKNWRAGYRINSLIDVFIYDRSGSFAGSYGINGGVIVKWEVSGHLAAPPDPVQMAHLHNVIMGPVEVIGQKCRFLVDFVCRIRLY